MPCSDATVLEICAGAGGQSSGLEMAGFKHACVVEIDPDAAATLRLNRPSWEVAETDVLGFDASDYRGAALLAGGVPCPPFSVAGKQLGPEDERDLFPRALELVRQAEPEAVMLENVKGLASPRFDTYRASILRALHSMGYETDWKLLHASWYGVPQLRPRFILVAMRPRFFARFEWPEPVGRPPTVGQTLYPLMAAGGWGGAWRWAAEADGIAPTVVGGSKKHGGADLGPTRSRRAWAQLGVDGRGVADHPPHRDAPLGHVPKLTNPMVALIQGFSSEWRFAGRKTSVYRQIGNAFPPPVAFHVGNSIQAALAGTGRRRPVDPLFELEALAGAHAEVPG
ncbi:MAG: DNA (cytosine-5-)-methyltransferase [Bifidobacteriaceae bacterium]|jgi:DNA (cytosine-5)-methyltransferase 1|nr:DNA (cytosine-5-)-methyltransferase [Bifidobacteriaceae bacterium]